MDLSVVVCTRDRPARAAAAIADILAQLRGGDELLVVDQSDDPAALAAAVDDPRARHLPDPGRGLPRARNLGVAATDRPIVVFFDDDVRLAAGCLDAHRAAYEDPWIGGVGGRIIERVVRPNARGTTNRVAGGGRVRARLDGRAACDLDTLKGANMSLRRAALRSAGPCDVGYAGTAMLEDADWSTRARALGWRLRFVPEAEVLHLSDPIGGCRADAEAWERWRFHNTARFLRAHRPGSAARFIVTFAAIACARAVRWRSATAAVGLARAAAAGWRSGAPRV